MPIAQCARVIFVCRFFLFWLLFIKKSSQNNILLTTIKFKTFQDYFVKFKNFKALNLVQSNSRLFKTFKAPYGPCFGVTCVNKCWISAVNHGSIMLVTKADNCCRISTNCSKHRPCLHWPCQHTSYCFHGWFMQHYQVITQFITQQTEVK